MDTLLSYLRQQLEEAIRFQKGVNCYLTQDELERLVALLEEK